MELVIECCVMFKNSVSFFFYIAFVLFKASFYKVPTLTSLYYFHYFLIGNLCYVFSSIFK